MCNSDDFCICFILYFKGNLYKAEKEKLIFDLEEEMRQYAKELNFEAAAEVRDAILELKASK